MDQITSKATSARDTKSGTWAATDGLGRVLPDHRKTGAPRKERYVGMFYFLWMGQHGVDGPYDVEKINAEFPEAFGDTDHPAWGPLRKFHHWGEAQLGYYLSDDRFVFRKHAQMLSDAGVDTLIFDVTNQATYRSCYMTLLEVFTQVRLEGGQTPQVAFLTPFWTPEKVVQELYDDLYGPGLFEELWFSWKGKPLIMADPAKVNPELREFFTFRKPEPSYFTGPSGPDQWGWLEVHPQHSFYNIDGNAEQVTVGVAANAVNGRLGSLSEQGALGRSFHNGSYPAEPYPTDYGYQFAEQWERALELDPEFVFVTGWNEWIAMRFESFNGYSDPVMFVDQYNQEFSRDIEPMLGGHADHYYYQLVDYVRRYKGVDPMPIADPAVTIPMDGDFSAWENVQAEYLDDAGDTMHRAHDGWGQAGYYTDTTGRNDFIRMKVAHDAVNVYFYVQTNEPITPYTASDSCWMNLLIKTKTRSQPNWEGYKYIVNRSPIDTRTTRLEASTGGWSWQAVCDISYTMQGNELELAIPREALGQGKEDEPIELEFKWIDNMPNPGDIQDFAVHGDAAPNGRFTYVYKTAAS